MDADDQRYQRFSDGATAYLHEAHHYYLTLQAKEVDRIKQLRLWGTGTVRCSGTPAPPSHGVELQWPDDLPASLPGARTDLPSGGETSAYAITPMFSPREISCGFHFYPDKLHGNQAEYFLRGGRMDVTGQDVTVRSSPSASKTITLTLGIAD